MRLLKCSNEVPELMKSMEVDNAPISASLILIVDDNEAAVAGLKKLLEYYKHRVVTAYTGEDALRVTREHQPDIIFLDIGLPDIDGYEVARQLRTQGWNRTIIALTGYGQTTDMSKSKDAGFDGHLLKPVGVKDLLAVIEKVQQSENTESDQ